jgi:glyoxylase-like metal-dependent hydrolase (beta-lactamase superfamily II)
MEIKTFFDARTWTLTYVVHDPTSRDAVIVDPVLDLDPASGRVFAESVDQVLDFVRTNNLNVRWILETHAHADHLTGAQELKRHLGAPVAIGRRITEVQAIFAPVFDLDIPKDGSQFDRLVGHEETLDAGTLSVRTLSTPGHTPACMSFVIGDAVFTGDALFMPDYGVGRCDFPGGSADALYTSVHDVLYTLPAATRVFVGHDYQPGGRAVAFETTIGASMDANIHLKAATSRADFVAFRTARDATLSAPKLLLPSIQVNVDAGRLPAPGVSGRRHLKLPIKLDLEPKATA